MWRYKITAIGILFSGLLYGQTAYFSSVSMEEESRDDSRRDAFVQNLHTIDELLFPEAYYSAHDDIYFETPDSLKAGSKLGKCFLRPETDGQYEPPPVFYYTWFGKQGQVEQTATVITETGDSVVHKWKYNTKGELILYCSYDYERQKEPKKGWFMSGDSIVFKRNNIGKIQDESRYSVTVDGKAKSNYLISKTVYTYDAQGKMLTKVAGGYTFRYSYDLNDRPVRIAMFDANNRCSHVDSLAWLEGIADDSIDHWAIVGKPEIRVNVDFLIINRKTSNQIRYLLFVPGKYNYIRDLTGPLDVRMQYDASDRLIVRGIYDPYDTLLHESVYTYDARGVIGSFSSTVMFNSEYHGAPPPQAAGKKNLYMSTVVTYSSEIEGSLPARLKISDVLFNLSGETRERVADRDHRGALIIVQEVRL